ncbi:hypothetical protein N493_18890 (plasmid) [Clostridium botulinum B2 433]|uniref:hypothetical protein n=1 Tax=Clostridium botulinum TaxID=1491 RepID=UPI0007E29A96|nr:hypothetical protein [Clostridium botulinum]KEI83980.1 hypothetical protein N493_18890 [Clostridium botulinum B2 433]
MIEKEIIYFGQKTKIACDGKCEKAWGINSRPKVQLDKNNEDDYAYLSDDELGVAPVDLGTYEGGYAKPVNDKDKLNKWCCRECERCCMSKPNKSDKPIMLEDFSVRVYNIPRS